MMVLGCTIYRFFENRSILHRILHSGLVQAYIGSDGSDGTARHLSLVEETGVPGENHRQQWVKTKNTTAMGRGSNLDQRAYSPGR